MLCIEHTTEGLERDRPLSLGFLDPSSSATVAALLGPDDILARLGRPDSRLHGVSLRLRPPARDDGGAPGESCSGAQIVELFTWSEEEYENLVRERDNPAPITFGINLKVLKI